MIVPIVIYIGIYYLFVFVFTFFLRELHFLLNEHVILISGRKK